MHHPFHIPREGRLGGEMHGIHDVSESKTLVRKEFLKFVGGMTVNPVSGRTAGYGLADLGEIFGRKPKFTRIPGHFPLLPTVFLD